DDRIARYFLYQLGHPINEFEFVHWVVNTDNFKLRENHEPISNDMLDRNFPGGADGTLLRIDDEWRFTSDDGTSTSRRNADWSYKDTEQAIRYHSEWILRSREADYDYDNFIEWVRTLETNFDEPTIDRLADADMMCINAAVRGYDADWDTLTLDRGKNGYFFRPKGGNGWMLLHWDGDRVFDRTNQAIIGNLAGVRNYFVNKPFIKRRLNYYLTKLLDEHTRGSARTEAWMQAEEDAVDGSDIESGGSGVTTTASATMNHYRGWFNNREANARNFVTSAVNNTDFEVTTNSSPTQDDTLDLTGTAPPDIFSIRVFFVNQDDSREALDSEFQWVDTTDWNLAGIPLRSGVNTLVLEGIDHLGNQVEEIDFTITKTTNAPPVVVVETSPKSKNVGLSETLVLDASGSYDPEGSALSYAWQVSPTDGVIMAPAGPMAMASFTVPGLYDFTTTATDDQAQATPHVVGVAVYGPESFSTFGEDTLEEFWDYSNIEKHPNSPNTPYFSLQDNEGRLTINIPLSMRPLGLPQPELPAAQMYVDYGANWSYDESGADLTGTFAQPGFDDGAWPVAPGFIGFGGINQPASFPDPPGYQSQVLTRGLVTYYFRTEFDFTDDAIGSQISINHVVDDGVRYYLNGQVLGSVRLPNGVIDNTTQATSNTNEGVLEEAVIGTEDTPYVDGSSYLVNGTNVLAAEVHNSSAGNSDLVFGARLNVAANPIGNGEVDLDDAIHPWIHRQLPAAEDWTLQTEVRLEKAQFGEFYAGLLVESEENGNAFRYGIGFKDGESVAALRVNPSGTSEVLTSVPAVAANLVGVRLQRVGDQLIFAWDTGENYTEIHRITLTAGLGTTFSKGGIFASTEIEQGLEASFDYAMLIDSTPASAVPLVVSEIMYHPATNPALEFIEIYNASLAEIDLEGFKLIDGEPVDAFTFPAFMLPSGGYGLLVSDQASFTAAYPEVPAGLIIGQWSGGNLGNSGDTITLTDAGGALITSFSYDDMAPWPTSPDGEGPSLVIINEQADLNPNLATSWRASVTNGGSPGAEDSAGPSFDEWMTENGFNDPQAEYKTSGLSNLLAYALGRDLAIAVEPVIGDSGGFATFSHRQRLGDSSLVYSVESSTNLIDWVAAGDLTQDGAPVSNGDGTVTITLLSNIPTSGRISTYYRLRVTAP
ncbi:MAG: lamin tail domain-containing protein, partial [Verrucomicrobiales bacterium]